MSCALNPLDPEPALLEITELAVGSAETPGRPLITHVDGKVRRGEFWVVLGGHGAGKTALLLTLAGLQPPLGGRVHDSGAVRGSRTEGASEEARPRVGVVFGDGGRLFHRMTLLENVALPLSYHENRPLAEVRPRAQALLEAVGLGEESAVTPGRLRPSLRPRAALARALAVRPEVLLLDNPTAGLSVPETGWWREVLQGLVKGTALSGGQRLALLVASPELAPWRELGTHFAGIRNGRWTSLGDRSDLASNPDPQVREWLDAGGGLR